MKIFELVSLPVLIAALVAMVNIFTEVVKRLFPVKVPQRVVVIWSIMPRARALPPSCCRAGKARKPM